MNDKLNLNFIVTPCICNCICFFILIYTLCSIVLFEYIFFVFNSQILNFMGFLGLPFILVFRFSVLIDFWHEADRHRAIDTILHNDTITPKCCQQCMNVRLNRRVCHSMFIKVGRKSLFAIYCCVPIVATISFQ